MRQRSVEMALKIERFVSPGKGNGLRAVNTIHVGEILHLAEPFACTVSNKFAKFICQHCFSRGETLQRCSQCKITRYCNTTCQRAAWTEHRIECRCLRSLHPRIPSDSVRLSAKIVFKLLNPSQNPPVELYSLAELESHLTHMSEEKKEGLHLLVSTLLIYLQQELPNLELVLPTLDLTHLLAQVTCNCFTISDCELQEVGIGLYLSSSLLNHECRPSCVMLFEGRTLQLRAVRDLQPGEELTISYTDVLRPTRDRQRHLQDQYHFLCHCQLCAAGDMDPLMLSGEESLWTPLRDASPRIEQLQTEQKWDQVLTECEALDEPLGGAVPDWNVYRLWLLDAALDACVNLGLWELALAYGQRTLEPYRMYYPDPHPARSVQLMRVGKLQHLLGHLEEAMTTFSQAYDIMKVTHGSQHSLTSDLGIKMELCQAEMESAKPHPQLTE